MSLQLFTNNAVALLNSSIGPTDLSIEVQPGLGATYPAPSSDGEFFLVTLESTGLPLTREIVKIIGVNGDTLIVDPQGRGQENTTAQSWPATTTLVDHRVTAATMRFATQSSDATAWNEPVRVADISSTVLPTSGAGQPITIQGQVIQNEDVVLFTALSANPNIYMYWQETGTFVQSSYTEDPPVTGTGTFVQGGSDAGSIYFFNGMIWFKFQPGGTSDDTFQNTFMGKAGLGSVTPTYSSTNFVANGESLVQAISELDDELGPDVTTGTVLLSSNTVNANLQALDGFLGTNGAENTQLNITTATQLDSVTARAIKYLAYVTDVSDSTTVRAFEIFVAHNGVTADISRYATLAFGYAPTDLDFMVTLTNGNTIQLSVMSTTPVNVSWKRLGVLT